MILRIVFAIIIGMLVTSILEWLTPIPRSIDILAGIVAAVFAYMQIPNQAF